MVQFVVVKDEIVTYQHMNALSLALLTRVRHETFSRGNLVGYLCPFSIPRRLFSLPSSLPPSLPSLLPPFFPLRCFPGHTHIIRRGLEEAGIGGRESHSYVQGVFSFIFRFVDELITFSLLLFFFFFLTYQFTYQVL